MTDEVHSKDSLRPILERARSLLPGGVSSPARAFGAVGGDPLFAERGEGAYLVSLDGRRFVDYIQGFGAVILGHAAPPITEAVSEAVARGGAVGLATQAEVRLAELVTGNVTSVDKVRFVASGTEASMTAARIARAATQRTLLVKFEGCYHGHSDAFLAKAGSGVATFSVPMAAGVPPASVADTAVVPFNDIAALPRLFEERGGEVAAVFVEPIAANMGVVPARPGFLQMIVNLCRTYGAVSIFDEVVTGFRIGMQGVQGQLDIAPDLTMLGKVLGGGLPIGAVGGRGDLMDLLAPVGSVYQAGTYAAHPHAMAAGAAALSELTATHFDHLEATASALADGLTSAAKAAGAEVCVVRSGTFLTVFFRAEPPTEFAEVQECDLEAFARFHRAMREAGILIAPSQFEAWFPSLAHGSSEIEQTVDAARKAFEEVRR